MPIPKDLSADIIVKRDGIYFYYWKRKQKIVKIDSFLPYLSHNIYFDDDITFEDFFKWIVNEPEKYSDVFHSHLGGHSLSEWLNEWNNPDPECCILDSTNENEIIQFLEVSWAVEYHSDDDCVSEWINFHGIGKLKDKNTYNDETWHDTAFSFSFIPLNEYKHYLFKINEEWRLCDEDAFFKLGREEREKMSAEELRNTSSILKTTKPMTVYDVIGSVLHEISWYGFPKNRDETRDKIQKTADYAMKNPDSLISFNSVDAFIKSLGKNKK